LFDIRQDENGPVRIVVVNIYLRRLVAWPGLSADRKCLVGVMIVVQCQANLLEVVLALGAGSGFAHFLHRRNQEGDEDGDDGDHHQQFDQGEIPTRDGREESTSQHDMHSRMRLERKEKDQCSLWTSDPP